MGAVDLVIQIESPTSVARGLQRIGRAGHQVDAPSRGVIFPKYRGDLLEAAVVAERMHAGAIETTVIPRNPLDVLAQQIVAMTVMDRWTVDELAEIVGRASPYESLSREALEGVLAMLAGAYPSDEFAELKARIVWDRVTGVVEGRRDARVVAVTSGGTIPDRGLFGVFIAGEPGTPGRRVGELDEEMVYELRAGMHGDVVVLGASSWRVIEIGHDRVIVEPAPGVPGKLPFWHGDAVGRPIELGQALGGLVRELEATSAGAARAGRLPSAGWRAGTTSTRWPPRTWSPTSRTSSSGRRAADRPADRGRALPRRARRLAPVPADAVRRTRPCALVAGPRGAPRRASGHGRPDDLVRRRHRDPAARGRAGRGRRTVRGRSPGSGDRGPPVPRTPRRSRTWSSASWPTRPCSPRGSGRTRPGRCSCPAAGRGRARRSGSSASARPTCWPSPAAMAASRSWSRPTASACPTSSTCRPSKGSWPGSPGARWPSIGSRPFGRRRSPARSCSTTSRPTCTRATRRSPSGGPRRSPSIATCCASCSARRSCASCSTAMPWPISSSGSRPSATSGPRPPSTSSTTSCAGSAT